MVEVNNKTRNRIDIALVKKVIEKFLVKYKKSKYDVSVAFVSDSVIRKLNKQYRKIDKITDVLSFDGEEKFLGEIIISYTQIKKQARIRKVKIKDELIFILVHGLLHLVGYNDETEKDLEKMKKIGEKFIKTL